MAKPLVTDEFWAFVEPLLPPPKPHPRGGRPPTPNRNVLTGILFVLKTGIPWEDLPQEMGCGSGMTCWRRLRDWQRAGVWDRLHRAVLDRLGWAGKIDWSRAAIDSAAAPAKRGGEGTGRNHVDRGRPGVRHHVVVDRKGTPLAAKATPANLHDSTQLEPMLDAVPPVRSPRGRRGRRRRRPAKLHADKAYDFRRCRAACRRRGIIPRIARRGVESSTRLGRHRWVVERTLAWFHRFRRLVIRYERRADIHQAFLTLAATMICWSALQRFC